MGEGAACRSSSSPPINTSLHPPSVHHRWLRFRCFRAQEGITTLRLSSSQTTESHQILILFANFAMEIVELVSKVPKLKF